MQIGRSSCSFTVWFSDFTSNFNTLILREAVHLSLIYPPDLDSWIDIQEKLDIFLVVGHQSSISVGHQAAMFYSCFPCAVYVKDVMDLFEEDESSGLILLVPVRLGSEVLNPIYIPCVKVYTCYVVLYMCLIWLSMYHISSNIMFTLCLKLAYFNDPMPNS